MPKIRTVDRLPWVEWAWVSDLGNPLGTVDPLTFNHVVSARFAIMRAMRPHRINRPR